MNKQNLVMKILVPVSTFIAGIFVPFLLDRLTKGANSEQQLTLLTLVGFLLALIVLVIAISVIFFEIHSAHKTIFEHHTDITSKIDEISSRLRIIVQYIEDSPNGNEGLSYEVTRKFVEEAQTSLIILDAWQQRKDYPLIRFPQDSRVLKRRQDYYISIIQQVEKHKYDKAPFLRYIIQAPAGSDLTKFKLIGGTVFLDYLKTCLKIREEASTATVIKLAPLVINIHCIIIDKRYIIWPIFIADPKRNGEIRRHGIIIFDDPLQQISPSIMGIYNIVDAQSIPFEFHHLQI